MYSSKFILGLAMSVFGGAAAFASPASAPAATVLPVPVSVIAPTSLPNWSENTTVKVQLTIDATGVPHDVKMVGYTPYELSTRVVPAVSKWRFTPMYRDGKPVSTSVILPLKLVADEAHG